MPSFSSISQITIFLLFCSTAQCQPLNSQTSSSSNSSIYEVLKSHGLPMGILPKGVKHFSFDENGRFEAHLDEACTTKLENELHYDRNVSGTVSYGQMGALSGISAQELFLWFPVKGIRVDIPSSGLIYFDVGVIFKQLSLSLFETPSDCKASEAVLCRDPPDSVSQSKCRKLRYKLDQENLRRAVV